MQGQLFLIGRRIRKGSAGGQLCRGSSPLFVTIYYVNLKKLFKLIKLLVSVRIVQLRTEIFSM